MLQLCVSAACDEVACPPGSTGTSVAAGCACGSGQSGAITATAAAPHYTSTCACDAATGWAESRGACQRNVDCVGAWGRCGTDCRRTFLVSVAKEGLGAACARADGTTDSCR